MIMKDSDMRMIWLDNGMIRWSGTMMWYDDLVWWYDMIWYDNENDNDPDLMWYGVIWCYVNDMIWWYDIWYDMLGLDLIWSDMMIW